MKRLLRLIAAAMLVTATPAHAWLKVFTCEPEWAALVKELGGEQVDVASATTGLENPHRIRAQPGLIARMRRADLMVCTGAQLEDSWLPVLLRRSANDRIQPGQLGYFEAAAYVFLRGMPLPSDPAGADIHPAGNPHIHTDPRNIAQIAQPLADRLMALDPARQSFYEERLTDFTARWQAAIIRWEADAVNLRGVPVATQHSGWVYLIHWLGLQEVIRLEAEPGETPSGARLSAVHTRLKRNPVKMILRAAYQDPRPSEWLAKRAHVPAVALPYTIGGSSEAMDLFSLFDDTLRRLREAVQ